MHFHYAKLILRFFLFFSSFYILYFCFCLRVQVTLSIRFNRCKDKWPLCRAMFRNTNRSLCCSGTEATVKCRFIRSTFVRHHRQVYLHHHYYRRHHQFLYHLSANIEHRIHFEVDSNIWPTQNDYASICRNVCCTFKMWPNRTTKRCFAVESIIVTVPPKTHSSTWPWSVSQVFSLNDLVFYFRFLIETKIIMMVRSSFRNI